MIARVSYKVRQLLRLPTRESILRRLPRHAVCAELGVFRGDFSRLILKHTRPREAHFVDVWWHAFGETFPDWGGYTLHGTLPTRVAYEEACAKIRRFPNTRSTVHAGDDIRYLSAFADAYFDWVYIDSSHDYEHTRAELELLEKKIKPGGVIAGHDWYDEKDHVHGGVRRAVEEFCVRCGWELCYRDNYSQWIIRRR